MNALRKAKAAWCLGARSLPDCRRLEEQKQHACAESEKDEADQTSKSAGEQVICVVELPAQSMAEERGAEGTGTKLSRKQANQLQGSSQWDQGRCTEAGHELEDLVEVAGQLVQGLAEGG